MTTTPQDTYVTFEALHPDKMNDEQRKRLAASVQAGLQRTARQRGLSVPEDPTEAEVERVHLSEVTTMEGVDGPVEVRTSTYRAKAIPMPSLEEPSVIAVEQEDGSWVADIPPGVAVVEVRHGLSSYDIRVVALDAGRVRTGFGGFVPITKNTVEVIPLPSVAHVLVLPPEEDEQDEAPAEVPESPRQRAERQQREVNALEGVYDRHEQPFEG